MRNGHHALGAIILLAWAGLLAAAPAPLPRRSADDSGSWQGLWRVTDASRRGMPSLAPQFEHVMIEVRGNVVTLMLGKGNVVNTWRLVLPVGANRRYEFRDRETSEILRRGGYAIQGNTFRLDWTDELTLVFTRIR